MIDTKELRAVIREVGLNGICLAEIFEILDRLEAAEKERDDLLASLDEGLDKTKWVQQGINEGTISAKHLGRHRADAMTSLLVEAEKDSEAALMAKLEAAEKERVIDEQRIADLMAELNRVGHENADLRAEVESWKGLAQQFGNEADAMRAKIAEMERQEPVAFALYSGWARKAVYLSESEACDQRDRRQLTADLGGSLEAYRVVPLYTRPGAQAQPAPSISPVALRHVIQWLRNGCDPMKAADELEMLAASPEAKP